MTQSSFLSPHVPHRVQIKIPPELSPRRTQKNKKNLGRNVQLIPWSTPLSWRVSLPAEYRGHLPSSVLHLPSAQGFSLHQALLRPPGQQTPRHWGYAEGFTSMQSLQLSLQHLLENADWRTLMEVGGSGGTQSSNHRCKWRGTSPQTYSFLYFADWSES